MFLCVSDCSSAHTEYLLFGLYIKFALHNILFGFKIFSILTHIKLLFICYKIQHLQHYTSYNSSMLSIHT